MISLIRSFFQSKLGIALTLGFVALIAVAFAASDVTGGQFGGVGGGDRAAKVGSETVGTGELSSAVSNAFEGQRQQNPTLTMPAFIASGAIGQVLDSMIDRTAIYAFGKKIGLVASDALVGSELAKIPAFQGPDGNFSQSQYRQVLGQQRLTDAQVRKDIAMGLVAKEVLVPVAFGAVTPQSLALRYGELSREKRQGAIGFIPATAFAPKAAPSDTVLAQFYKTHAARYTQPERRTIRYAVFGDDAVKNLPAPTDAQIAQAYAADKAAYAPSETRTITQVIVPTQAAAAALEAEVKGGKALDIAARAKGLLPSQSAVTREALTAQASAAVAQAVFAAPKGALATPAKSGLGWHVVRIDAITQKAGKTLAEARPEIVAQLTDKARRAALNDFTAKIEDQIDNGGKLADIARELGVTPQSTAPITADGKVFGQPNVAVAPELARVVQTAFLMEGEGSPQLAEVEPGKRFVVFEAAQIIPAAPPALAQIKPEVVADWQRTQGAVAAKAASDKVLAATAKGAKLADALRSAGVPSPQIEAIDATRQQVAQSGRVAPPLALLFSMAQNTTKRLEAPNSNGWFVVHLDAIQPGKLDPKEPVVAQLATELGQVSGREYAEQFRRALRDEVGVKRNAGAEKAVRDRLVGTGN